jgi:hypothetical protein
METFKKRQKEMQRLERQRDKAAKRMERKLHRANGTESPADETPVDVTEAQSEAQSGAQSEDKPAIEPRSAQ